jgi:uncharacterized protein YraI
MEKGVWCKWQLLIGAVLAMVCLSCQPKVAPLPRQAPPPPPATRPEPPQRPSLYVKVGRLNLRAGPGMDFPKLGSLERNEEVEKLGEAENWYQVRVKRDGTLGWVSSEYLSSTPVTSPIETPVPETPSAPSAKEKVTPPTPDAEPKKPKPAKVETPAPREPKPAEAAEPPPRKAKPIEEAAPPPAPKAQPEKPAPRREEPPPAPPPAPPPPEEKPSGIRIM